MLKALVIEHKEIADILSFILRQDGLKALTVSSVNGVDEVANFNADVIIVHERNTSALPGHALIRLLKQDPRTKAIPALLTSTHYSVKEIANACGADGYISKPFENSQVTKLVNKLLNR